MDVINGRRPRLVRRVLLYVSKDRGFRPPKIIRLAKNKKMVILYFKA